MMLLRSRASKSRAAGAGAPRHPQRRLRFAHCEAVRRASPTAAATRLDPRPEIEQAQSTMLAAIPSLAARLHAGECRIDRHDLRAAPDQARTRRRLAAHSPV